MPSEKKKGILGEQSILIIAEKTCQIREFEIKKIVGFQSVDEGEYGYIIEHFSDPSSSSKEAKIQAILRYLNGEPDRLIGFVHGLIEANKGFLAPSDIKEMNAYLILDELEINPDTLEIIPTREMPARTLHEEIAGLEEKLDKLGFASSLNEYREGLKAIPKDVVGIVTRFRRFLEELLKEIIIKSGETPRTSPVENRDFVEQILNFYNPTRARRSNFRSILDGVYGMLSELGSHPPITASFEELLFLIHTTIELSLRLLYLYEEQQIKKI